uniref:hypothetical protein n=1 Tax=Brucella pseudintermedia TaxID=370111 RepID=UPI00158E6AD7|nr:hypothetical protein [Brucella pseudintermedia]
MAREPYNMTQEQIDNIAQRLHSYEADDYTLKWGKQTSKYRNNMRKSVRNMLSALEHNGFKLAGRSPAPAATDMRLETVAKQWKVTAKNWSGLKPEISEPFDERELVTRSQAEELLAAQRAEPERLADDYQAIREQLHRGWQECCALKADNAEKDARIKELEQALETEKTLSRGDWACQREVDQMSIKVEALEAKLAAAEKALELIDKAVSEGRFIRIRKIARAVLGGKPS